MEQKSIFLALFLFASANVQCRVLYDQYDEHPVVSKIRSESKNGRTTSSGSLNKNRENRKFDKLMNQRLGDLGELRRFQKATNSLRRNNVVESDDFSVKRSPPVVCRTYGNMDNMRRLTTQYANGDLNRKIQELVRMSILQKYKQAMDGLLSENVSDDPAIQVNSESDVNFENEEVDDDDDGDDEDGLDEY